MGTSGRQKLSTALRVAGLARIVLAAALIPALIWAAPGAGAVAFVSVGLALVFGTSLVAGRPRFLAPEPLAAVLVDSLLVSLLVAGTGGADSPFFALYLLAALGVAGVSGPAGVTFAAAALGGGYLLAAGLADGPESLGRALVVLGAGFIALACWGAAHLGRGIGDLAAGNRALSSDLDVERDRASRSEALIPELTATLESSSVEEILSRTARAARAGCGAVYAHVASLEGEHHASVLESNADACPSWWHPRIQDLLMRACREGGPARSDEEVHGIDGFLAVPVAADDGPWGAVVVGGGPLGTEEERVLGLVAAAVGPVLGGVGDALGGRDPVSGLPNGASLHRFLRRGLARGRALTVFVAKVGGLDRYNRTRGFAAGDDLLRRVGGRLGRGRRAFHPGGDDFVVVLGGTDEARARRAALAIRQAVSEVAADAANPAFVGFAHAAEGQDEDPAAVLKRARLALREAELSDGGVAAFRVPGEVPAKGSLPAGIVEALMGALEAKEPGIGEHLRGVAALAGAIARRMGLSEGEADGLVAGALLHDVGKIGIPEEILRKPGRLTEEEYETIKRHPVMGVEIVLPTGAPASTLAAIRHHHERFDGEGYPDGLLGGEIPPAARVLAVADAFDAMIRARPYGYSAPREAALREVEKNSGTQFDPEVVAALRAVLADSDEHLSNFAG